MKENKGNKIIIIGVVCLLLVVVVATSYSYFLANAGSSGDASVNVVTKTTNIGDAQLEVVGVLAFDDKDILPGHKNISSIKVTARGSSDKILYNLIWKGSNGLGSPLKFTVYKTNNQVNASVSCDKKIENAHGGRVYFEECSVNNVTNLGSVIKSGEISQGNSKTTLVQNENINLLKRDKKFIIM